MMVMEKPFDASWFAHNEIAPMMITEKIRGKIPESESLVAGLARKG